MIRNAKVSLIMARFAKVADGLVDVMGGGITVMGAEPAAVFIAGTVEMPWEAAGVHHEARLDLIDAHGNPVVGRDAAGAEVAVEIHGQFDVAPMPGLARGSQLVLPLAISAPPVPLSPGSRYEWRLWIDGETHEDWRLGFSTLPVAQSNAA